MSQPRASLLSPWVWDVILFVGLGAVLGWLWLQEQKSDKADRAGVQLEWESADADVIRTERDLAEQKRSHPDRLLSVELLEKPLARKKAQRQEIEERSQQRWGKHPRDL